MIKRELHSKIKADAAKMMVDAGLVLREDEIEQMDVADFGLGDVMAEGAQIVSFFNTKRVSAKVIALFPNQTLPEHWHISVAANDEGKEETFRVIKGELYLVVEGEDTLSKAKIPKGKRSCYRCRHEIALKPGDQITLPPGEKHWLQAGDAGCVTYSFSSMAVDALDPFTDNEIVRVTKIVD